MKFGRARWCVLQHTKSKNPQLGPVYLSKIDISDGFYRVRVLASDAPMMGILFPSEDGEEYLMGFPLTLYTGWTESPKTFTTATKTVVDIANPELSSGQEFVKPYRSSL
jgi:hypothetical protein